MTSQEWAPGFWVLDVDTCTGKALVSGPWNGQTTTSKVSIINGRTGHHAAVVARSREGEQ